MTRNVASMTTSIKNPERLSILATLIRHQLPPEYQRTLNYLLSVCDSTATDDFINREAGYFGASDDTIVQAHAVATANRLCGELEIEPPVVEGERKRLVSATGRALLYHFNNPDVAIADVVSCSKLEAYIISGDDSLEPVSISFSPTVCDIVTSHLRSRDFEERDALKLSPESMQRYSKAQLSLLANTDFFPLEATPPAGFKTPVELVDEGVAKQDFEAVPLRNDEAYFADLSPGERESAGLIVGYIFDGENFESELWDELEHNLPHWVFRVLELIVKDPYFDTLHLTRYNLVAETVGLKTRKVLDFYR
jgi:hypothetical protein